VIYMLFCGFGVDSFLLVKISTVCVYGACGNESSVAELPAPQISSL
jgi:hypothetical protein